MHYPNLENTTIQAICPTCNGALTNFTEQSVICKLDGKRLHFAPSTDAVFMSYTCVGCGRGAVSIMETDKSGASRALIDFWPVSVTRASLPEGVPATIENEFREAEDCASVPATRAALAMFRSALEKVLVASGYNEHNLYEKICAAADDLILTESLRKKANIIIKDAGNDVLHGEWRKVPSKEVEESHLYTQRVIEAFYDDRDTVVEILHEKKRIESEPKADSSTE